MTLSNQKFPSSQPSSSKCRDNLISPNLKTLPLGEPVWYTQHTNQGSTWAEIKYSSTTVSIPSKLFYLILMGPALAPTQALLLSLKLSPSTVHCLCIYPIGSLQVAGAVIQALSGIRVGNGMWPTK